MEYFSKCCGTRFGHKDQPPPLVSLDVGEPNETEIFLLPERDNTKLKVGDLVDVNDHGDDGLFVWHRGQVTDLKPLKVRVFGASRAFVWDQVVAVDLISSFRGQWASANGNVWTIDEEGKGTERNTQKVVQLTQGRAVDENSCEMIFGKSEPPYTATVKTEPFLRVVWRQRNMDNDIRWIRMPAGRIAAMHGKWKQTNSLDGEHVTTRDDDGLRQHLMSDLPSSQQLLEIAIYMTPAGEAQFEVKGFDGQTWVRRDFMHAQSFDGRWLGENGQARATILDDGFEFDIALPGSASNLTTRRVLLDDDLIQEEMCLSKLGRAASLRRVYRRANRP